MKKKIICTFFKSKKLFLTTSFSIDENNIVYRVINYS